eukprot:CAMPEP_0183406622 /NCGR_PEP_ID=MMETSP0370-20130417/16735_1 /TAXON_ID=268820 /ORGANISM="Peridinium aciculiferum, Strain PAER-2" /LENGTH=103 /DNA_ID=CAMNT_0025588825 /DNA_START=172 /DNA_END=481 /DNA_ORIENTATION=-
MPSTHYSMMQQAADGGGWLKQPHFRENCRLSVVERPNPSGTTVYSHCAHSRYSMSMIEYAMSTAENIEAEAPASAEYSVCKRNRCHTALCFAVTGMLASWTED